ncbi:unnamed protein product [Paramecium primaurelia]|uniref:Uncharacterized protein n=1 Tax=Paramecium primaurelia TaxID=5886 RepID=A0A8S1PKR9_PARPR|nr:unnamed protein product [Paramecium primaurelia]
MYKLNTMQGRSFFNFQAPINYLSKKNLFQSATEIKPKRMDTYGRLIVAQSLPKEFWFRDYLKSNRKYKKESLIIYRHQNPIFCQRMEQFQHLQAYSNQASTPSPSKKWKKFKNIILTKNSQTTMTSEIIKQKFKETLNLLIPQKFQSSPKSVRYSVQSPTKNISDLSIQTTNNQIQKLDGLDQNRINYIPSLLSIDKQIKENSINQSNTNNNSFIQYKDISSNQVTPRNRFIKDCCRLYGLDSHMLPSINKLVFSDQIQLIQTNETNNDKIEIITKSIEKQNYKQNTLLNLIRKQKIQQINQKQRQHSSSLKKIKCNLCNNSVSRVMSTYFPSLKKVIKRNLS